MFKDDQFIFDVLKSFSLVNKHSFNVNDFITLKKSIFKVDNFLKLKLSDRKLLLLGEVSDKHIDTFLTYLYNCEIDHQRIDHIHISTDIVTGPIKKALKVIAKECAYNYDVIGAAKQYVNNMNVSNLIGYEEYFFNLKDELILEISNIINLSLNDYLSYYNIDDYKWIINDYDHKLKDILNVMFLKIKTNNIYNKLFLKLLSRKIIVMKKLVAKAMTNFKDIYIRSNVDKKEIKSILFHEASHILYNYEKRYFDFEKAYSNMYDKKDLKYYWFKVIEEVINQKISFFDNTIFKNVIVEYDNPLITSIVQLTLMSISNQRKEFLTWK